MHHGNDILVHFLIVKYFYYFFITCIKPVVSLYEPDDKLNIVKVYRTAIMLTYLVAFVVGEFDYYEERSAEGVQCRVYTPVGKKEQIRFVLYVMAKVLPYFKEYVGIEYSLPKMNLVAIAAFAAGKSQSWKILFVTRFIELIYFLR